MTHDAETVERVAKAMAFARRQNSDESKSEDDYWEHTGYPLRIAWIECARAALSALPSQEVSVHEAAKVREAVGRESLEVNRAFIIAAQARPAHAAKAIHEVELILEKAVKSLRALSEKPHE